MAPTRSTKATCRDGTWRTATPFVLAVALAFHSVWLPAHLVFDAHLGDGHSHDRSGERALPSVRLATHGHGHDHADHAHGHHHGVGHDHARTTPSAEGHELSVVERDHGPHEPHHPITDHQPPVVVNQGASGPTLALVDAQLRLPEPLLLARVRARPPPGRRGVPPPQPFSSRAPPSA